MTVWWKEMGRPLAAFFGDRPLRRIAETRQAVVPVLRRLQGAQELQTTGRASADRRRLFETARSKPAWFFAYVAATLDFFCGLRACEIKALQWQHVS